MTTPARRWARADATQAAHPRCGDGRVQHATFFHRWMGVLDVDSSKRSQLLSRVLIAIMSEASLMVAMCDDVADVEPITDATIEWIGRLRT
jgi:hypothetical protein